MNADPAMEVEEGVRKKGSSRWGLSPMGVDEEIRNAMEVEIRRVTEEEEFDKNITNARLEEEEVIRNKIHNLLKVESVRKKRSSRWGSSSMGVESVRKKRSSRWGSSSMGVMDEEIRNAMEVEIRRLTEEEEEVVLNKIRNLLQVERVDLFELMMGVTDEEIRKEGEKIQKKIRNAIHEETKRLGFMRLREKIRFLSRDEIRNAMELEITRREFQTYSYLMEMDRAEQIRDRRWDFVLHISPLEIIDNPGDQDFINVAADNINQTELVIIVMDHHTIHQYWTPRTSATTTSSSCQHHDDFLHPPDDDEDEEMILAACRPLLDSPRRLKIILDQGVFAAASDDEQHIMSTLLGSVGVLFEYSILPTYKHLEDLKTSITRSISEAKPHVARVKPKRVRICVQASRVQKQYYGSKEDAIDDATVDDAQKSSACHPMDDFYWDPYFAY